MYFQVILRYVFTSLFSNFRINEACPHCSKPLMGGTAMEDQSGVSRHHMYQRVCRNCRGRIGLCFLCHQPVKGIFVWCPGCGHGGHCKLVCFTLWKFYRSQYFSQRNFACVFVVWQISGRLNSGSRIRVVRLSEENAARKLSALCEIDIF